MPRDCSSHDLCHQPGPGSILGDIPMGGCRNHGECATPLPPVPQLMPTFHMATPNPLYWRRRKRSGRKWKEGFLTTPLSLSHPTQEAYSVARQFNLIPPVCEQAEHHLFQREKVEMQLPELYHKIGSKPPRPYLSLGLSITWIPFPTSNPLPLRRWLSHLVPSGLWPHH